MKLSLPASLIVSAAFAASANAAPDWTYDEDYTGQEGWASLSEAYSACEDGTRQSPVQIGQTLRAALPEFTPPHGSFNMRAQYQNHAPEFYPLATVPLRYDNHFYTLKKIRLHFPSEHMVGNVYYLGEIRFFFESRDTGPLVAAAFVNIGEGSKAVESLLAAYEKKQSTVLIEPEKLFPSLRGYYRYAGSLPYPPCTENVEWLVFKTPLQVNKNQQERFSRLAGRNTRLPQPVYFRTIYETDEKAKP